MFISLSVKKYRLKNKNPYKNNVLLWKLKMSGGYVDLRWLKFCKADTGGPDIDDPVAWQREIRCERSLPGRNNNNAV
jgi:hypothetical protein